MPLLKRWMTETQAYAIQTNIPWRHADHMFINSWFSPANMKIKTVYDSDLELQSCPGNDAWMPQKHASNPTNKSVHRKRFPMLESVHFRVDLELLRCHP